MNYFEIHLVEHCNLKCKGCDNFSSLAKEEYLDIELFENDIKRMHELFPKIQLIRLLGGEPLLHPQLTDFFDIIRNYYKYDTTIMVTTNAILLDKMPVNFWNNCHANDITIEYTYYPINLDRDKHKKLAEQYDVKLIPFSWEYKENKTLHRMPITDNKNDNYNNYNNCHKAKYKCVSLKQGKIYPCPTIPNIYHFNKFFNKHLEVTKNDYIDIYNHTAYDIDEFLTHAVPFCGYCNVNNITYDHKWETTKYNINEWYDE